MRKRDGSSTAEAWLDLNTHPISPNQDDIPNFVESKSPSATHPGRGWKSNLLIKTALIWCEAWCHLLFPSLWWAEMIFSWALWEVLWRKILFLIWVVNLGNLEHARCASGTKTKFWDILKWNWNLMRFIVLFSHINSLNSQPHDVGQPLNATFPLNYTVSSCMHVLWLMGLPHVVPVWGASFFFKIACSLVVFAFSF